MSNTYQIISSRLHAGDDAMYALAVELLVTVQCVVKRTQLWKQLFSNVRAGKRKDEERDLICDMSCYVMSCHVLIRLNVS